MEKTAFKRGRKFLKGLSKPGTDVSRGDAQPATQVENSVSFPELGWETSLTWVLNQGEEPSNRDGGKWASMVYDLLHTMGELGRMLQYTLSKKDWLNAYLVAAGMNQIAEDYLHPDPLYIQKIGKYLIDFHGIGGNLIKIAVEKLAQALLMVNELRPSTRRILRWQRQLAIFVSDLATMVVSGGGDQEETIIKRGDSILQQVVDLPESLMKEFIRLPSCFRSFDQQPEDLRRIAGEFSLHWTEKNEQYLVIGVRTSGSYLAPLYGAFLNALGYQNVKVFTYRPSNPLLYDERKLIRKLTEKNGLALICDDPPISGMTIAKTAQMLEKAGVPSRKIVLLLQLNHDPSFLPGKLQKYPAVLMSDLNWSIFQRLNVEQIKQTVEKAYSPENQISSIVRLLHDDEKMAREHIKAFFRVEMVNTRTGQLFTRQVQVKGVGLGYFGEHELEIAVRLPNYSPHILALKDGLLYQEISNHPRALKPSMVENDEYWKDQLVDYIVDRNHRLAVGDDHSIHIMGRNAVWEVASNILSNVFGRGKFIARLPIIDPFVKSILGSKKPSVIDGDMELKDWQINQEGTSVLVKMNLAERAFSHMDLTCYDPVYDLAGLAIQIENDRQGLSQRRRYELKSGDKISPERWMLYQLVRLWDLDRQEGNTRRLTEVRMAKVVQDYYSAIFFSDLESTHEGPLCAIDIDGVLETNQLGFPSLTKSSATSLRALIQHGYRVVLATGRCVDDVKDRCSAYHLAGGVAEYGAVLYDQGTAKVVAILSEAEQALLFRVKGRLLNTPEIHLDLNYRNCIRAFTLDRFGNQKGLDDETVNEVLDTTGTSNLVHAIRGKAQTDFMVTQINKGIGLEQWLMRFSPTLHPITASPTGAKPFALVVGDSESDISLSDLAAQAYMPAHVKLDTKDARFRIVSKRYQGGFEQAVTRLLGHTPGACPICKQIPLPRETSYMLDLLSVQENGALGMISRAIKLYFRKFGDNHVHTK